MWLQGLAAAPEIVKRCCRSWQEHNPDWQIIYLDQRNLHEYMDVSALIGESRQDIAIQAFSDFARINLLAAYGGVWVDATCFACVPLDTWVHDYTASGFFAFCNPAKDRLLSSWFLASAQECHLTSRYCEEVNRFLLENRFNNQRKARIRNFVNRRSPTLYGNKHLAGLWPLNVMAKAMRVYPYYWFHYVFAGLVKKDALSRRIWRDTPKYRAAIPLKLWRSGYWKPPSAELRDDIDTKRVPVYKLNRHIDEGRITRGCALTYLLQSAESK